MIGGAAGAVPVLIGWSSVTGQPRPGRRSCCSPSSSTGPRRTSGRSPSSTGTTTRPPTCRCSRRWPACARRRSRILVYTLVLWALTLAVRPGRRHGRPLPRGGDRARRRVHRGWPSGSCADADSTEPRHAAVHATRSPTSRCCSVPWPSTHCCARHGSDGAFLGSGDACVLSERNQRRPRGVAASASLDVLRR